jgi:hypothetical protein
MAGNMVEMYKITKDERYIQIASQQIGNIIPSLGFSGPLLSSWAHKIMLFALLPK